MGNFSVSETGNQSIITQYAEYIKEAQKGEAQPKFQFSSFTVKQLEKLLELVPSLKSDGLYVSALFCKRFAQQIQDANKATKKEKIDVLRQIYEAGKVLPIPAIMLRHVLYNILNLEFEAGLYDKALFNTYLE